MASNGSSLNGYGFISSLEAEKTRNFCDPCKFTGKKLQAKGYCKVCDGHLCKDCLKVHRSSKDTRMHDVIPESKYSAAESTDAVLRCEEHQATIESYCNEHDKLCCHLCISVSHRMCKVLTPIQRAATGIRDGSNIPNLTAELETLLTQFMRRKTEEENEMKQVTKQGENLAKLVKDFRKRVNTILDKAESALYMKKDEFCKAESLEVFGRYKACENAIPVLHQAKTRLEKLKKDVSEQNSFIVTKKVETVIHKFKPVLEELVDKRGAFSVKFIPNQDLIDAMQSLGSLVVRESEHFVGIKTEIPSNVAVQERKLHQSGEIIVKGNSDKSICTITGCTFLSDSRIVIVDETNKTLKIISDDNKVSHTHKLNVAPWDVVYLPNNLVVIRSSFSDNENDENSVKIFSVADEIKPAMEFKVDSRPRAIVYSDTKMYVACTEGNTSQILVLDENYKTERCIQPAPGVLKQPQYMCINKSAGKLYISDFYKGIVMLDFNGDVIAELKDSCLTEYGGITTDANGDVYLCAGKPYGVYKMAQDGKSVVALVTWDEGKIDPQTIAYNPKTDKFVVTSCSSNKAFIFSYIDANK